MVMKRLRIMLAALVLAVAGGVFLAAGPAGAIANVGNNWCLGTSAYCMNAWNGGPWVKLYSGGPTANGDFGYSADGGGQYHYLAFGNYGSPWANQCIGDANNDPGDARASLNPCPGLFNNNYSGDGWGTHLTVVFSVCNPGYYAFHDTHWNGWIGPADTSGGSQFYLNKQQPWCFKAYDPR
jgi:hypothetical protein